MFFRNLGQNNSRRSTLSREFRLRIRRNKYRIKKKLFVKCNKIEYSRQQSLLAQSRSVVEHINREIVISPKGKPRGHGSRTLSYDVNLKIRSDSWLKLFRSPFLGIAVWDGEQAAFYANPLNLPLHARKRGFEFSFVVKGNLQLNQSLFLKELVERIAVFFAAFVEPQHS